MALLCSDVCSNHKRAHWANLAAERDLVDILE